MGFEKYNRRCIIQDACIAFYMYTYYYYHVVDVIVFIIEVGVVIDISHVVASSVVVLGWGVGGLINSVAKHSLATFTLGRHAYTHKKTAN